MSEQSDVILTPNSYDDGFLERWLDRVLWGYPKLVDACPFSVLADVRRKNLEDSLVTRPGFSFKEPRRAASAGLVSVREGFAGHLERRRTYARRTRTRPG